MNIFLRIAVWLIVSPHLASSWAAQPSPRSVLILNQENATTPYHSEFFEAFRSTLNVKSRAPVAIYSETLEFNEFAAPEYEELFINYVREKYRKHPVGVSREGQGRGAVH